MLIKKTAFATEVLLIPKTKKILLSPKITASNNPSLPILIKAFGVSDLNFIKM